MDAFRASLTEKNREADAKAQAEFGRIKAAADATRAKEPVAP